MGQYKRVYRQPVVEGNGDESIKIVRLSNDERDNGPFRLGPFMLVIRRDMLESVSKQLPKEAYGL